ncbi:hypothetical protein ACFQ44_08395 [Levilactobacillus lanxiensis]|uniref:DUF1453 domain-containing protein n=1 Tax=Levilactobacillus lanxiensis TaxID=2799568 RepID=A0ABW4D4L5_9LACO|nr:hypothetical protein [Levilactobacillus lanxiensis]
MQNLDLTNLVLGAWLLFVVIKRQLAPKVVRFKMSFFVLVTLLGAASIGDAFNKQHLQISPSQAVVFGGLSLASAIIFALLRAWSYRFWVDNNGLVIRQGNWLTLVWWVVGIAGHLGVDRLWTGSSVTLLLYLGVTLLVQRGCVWWLASQKYPTEMRANAELQAERHHDRSRRKRRRE